MLGRRGALIARERAWLAARQEAIAQAQRMTEALAKRIMR